MKFNKFSRNFLTVNKIKLCFHPILFNFITYYFRFQYFWKSSAKFWSRSCSFEVWKHQTRQWQKIQKVNIAAPYIFSFCQSNSPLLKLFEKWTFWFETFETKRRRGNWNSRETLLLTQVQLMMFICVIEKCSGVCVLKTFFLICRWCYEIINLV
jgi:hypothetical protein